MLPVIFCSEIGENEFFRNVIRNLNMPRKKYATGAHISFQQNLHWCFDGTFVNFNDVVYPDSLNEIHNYLLSMKIFRQAYKLPTDCKQSSKTKFLSLEIHRKAFESF